ncbi:MAG: hypothetical protein AAGI52_04720 [Bacteroidota bacterium]
MRLPDSARVLRRNRPFASRHEMLFAFWHVLVLLLGVSVADAVWA